MEVTISREELKKEIIAIMKELDFVPKNESKGKTITLAQFKKSFVPEKALIGLRKRFFTSTSRTLYLIFIQDTVVRFVSMKVQLPNGWKRIAKNFLGSLKYRK